MSQVAQGRSERFGRLRNWWDGTAKKVEDDASKKLYVNIERSIVAAIRRKEFDDYLRYVYDPYQPAEFRMHALIKLVANNAIASGPKNDANLGELLQIWNSLVGQYWMPLVMLKWRREKEARGLLEADNTVGVPIQQLEEAMQSIADRHFIHRGVTLVELMYGDTDHVPEFTNIQQMMPTMAAGAGGGMDSELKEAVLRVYTQQNPPNAEGQ